MTKIQDYLEQIRKIKNLPNKALTKQERYGSNYSMNIKNSNKLVPQVGFHSALIQTTQFVKTEQFETIKIVDEIKFNGLENRTKIAYTARSKTNYELILTAEKKHKGLDFYYPSIIRNLSLPEKWDLSEKTTNWPVLNQYSSSACVGFTIADGLFNFMCAKNRFEERPFLYELEHELDCSVTRFSPRYMWQLGKENDNNISPLSSTLHFRIGTDLEKTLDGVFNSKLAHEEIDIENELFYPFFYFKEEKLNIISNKGFLKANVSEYVKITDSLSHGYDFNKLKMWLYVNGPIAVDLKVDNNFNSDYLKNNCCLVEYDSTNVEFHAMTLVGWKTIRINNKEEKVFKFKNSWGALSGEDGYVYLSESYFQQALLKAFAII